MDPTTFTTLGGGLLGAAIKLLVGGVKLWARTKSENNERQKTHELALANKQMEFKKLGPDPDDYFVSFTRRVLAWWMCGVFGIVVLLWAVFPGYPILTDGGTSGYAVNLFAFDRNKSANLVAVYTTGTVVLKMFPMISMIIMTYFTPDISKR